MPTSLKLSFICVDAVSNCWNNLLILIYADGFYLCRYSFQPSESSLFNQQET